MPIKMVEVSRDKFYATIGRQNVHPQIQPGPWPYTSIFKTPMGEVRGKIVGIEVSPGFSTNRYYLVEVR